MKKYTRYLGLDVHSETIAVPVCDGGGGEVRYLGVIANSAEALRKLIKQLQVKEKNITGLLRSGPLRLRGLRAARSVGRELRCGRADADSAKERRLRQKRIAKTPRN